MITRRKFQVLAMTSVLKLWTKLDATNALVAYMHANMINKLLFLINPQRDSVISCLADSFIQLTLCTFVRNSTISTRFLVKL